MKENIIQEILEAEFLVDDELCVNGCQNVRFEETCSECGFIQDLMARTMQERVEDTVDLIAIMK